MGISQIQIADLKTRVSLASLINEKVRLTRQGSEYKGLCPFHKEKTPSFSVYTDVHGKERYMCFGCGASGDHFDWLAHLGFDLPEAIEYLRQRAGKSPPVAKRSDKASTWEVVPPPPDQPPPTELFSARAKCMLRVVMAWRYCDENGSLLGYVCRLEHEGKKEIIPVQWANDGQWRQRAFPEPRPLYGVERLTQHPRAKVLLVEGEKTTDAARRLLSEFSTEVVTWSGGCHAIHKTNWQPLAGRDVVCWPDHDAPGESAMLAIADKLEKLGARVRVVKSDPDWPENFDLADLESDGWTGKQVREYLHDNLHEPSELNRPASKAKKMHSHVKKSGGTEGTEWNACNDGASSGSLTKMAEGTEGTAVLVRPFYQVYDEPSESMRAGVYLHGQRPGKGRDAPPVEFNQWICSPLHVIAITSRDGADFGRLLRFRNTLGHWCNWAMPMHLLKGSGEDLRGELLNMGVEIDPDAFRVLNRYLQSQQPKRRMIAAASTGWHGKRLFIMPSQNIGEGEAIFQSESSNLDDYRKGGTLDGWQAEIGNRCVGNPILMLAVCTALAGPLLFHLKRSGGGFHIYGDSSQGKTAAEQAGASVWGHGKEFMRSWRSTSNGLEGVAALHNDTLLALDEIGEADPREIGNLVYGVTNGVGRSRATRTGAARKNQRWQLMLLSSGELTLSQHMAEAGKLSRAGQEIRMLDIRADQNPFGAWAELHGLLGGREFSDAILSASTTHYGHAGPAFVGKLLECGEVHELPTMLAELRQIFPIENGQEGRAAERFAIVAMAGELAIAWGILPAPEGSARDAMLVLYNDWRSNQGKGLSEDAKIRKSIRNFLSRYGEAMFSQLGVEPSFPIRDRAGWWKMEHTPNGDRRVWLFTSEGLRRAAGNYDINRIISAVDAADWFTERKGGKNSKRVAIDGEKIWLYHLALTDEHQATPGRG
jgi:putative DNA primase/helicase